MKDGFGYSRRAVPSRINILINVAGVMLNGLSIEPPLEHWNQMVDVIRRLMYTTKAALPHLVESVSTSSRKVVDVVNISSVASRTAAVQVAISTTPR